jgi:hypothetical protein
VLFRVPIWPWMDMRKLVKALVPMRTTFFLGPAL